VSGGKSGIKAATVELINQRVTIEGQEYHGLVQLKDLGFTSGDSGSPVLKIRQGFAVGAMNIGTQYDSDNVLHNYANSWSYMQSQLGLRD